MMRIALLNLLVLTCMSALGQWNLDTIQVYNVHCSYTDTTGDTVNIYKWGDTWTYLFPPEACPEPAEKYKLNRDTITAKMEAGLPLWFMLYNTQDKLIYEGVWYQGCTVGAFIIYHPNGKVKTRGQYSGLKYHKGKFKLEECDGKPTGTWITYNLIGAMVQTTHYD